MRYLVAVCNRTRAQFWSYEPSTANLQSLCKLDEEKGQSRDGDIDSAPQGRSFGPGGGRHTYSREVDAHGQVASVFSKRITDRLAHEATQHNFHRIYVAAEPGFLGRLNSTLPQSSAAVRTIGKSLGHLSPPQLVDFLKTHPFA